jgi:hypothetical protein
MSLIVLTNADDHHVHGVFTSLEKISDVIKKDLTEYGEYNTTYRYAVHRCILDKDFDSDPVYFKVGYDESGHFAFCTDVIELKSSLKRRTSNDSKWTDTLIIRFE